ncbi:MAG: hypothetical protein A4E72_00404 [Syntrophus sp. PtaU1.Bin208]|nr:MAG: hypothetical protein A4E72_00404 [Syntrophus sp. PtaU1.Bin208]
MKRILFGILLLSLLTVFPLSAKADVDVNVTVGIPLPPAIVFSVPPVTVVIPGTYVYAVPDVPQDIFFYGGWWWRPWEGHWYRSPHYDRGWAYYKGAPSFYRHVPQRWRENYRDRRWQGHPWNSQRVPAQQLPSNWRGWEKNKHWEKQQHWGVPAMKTKKGAPPPHRSVQPPPRPEQREMHGPPHQPQPHEGKGIPPGHQKDKHGKGEGGNGHGHGYGHDKN